MFLETVLEMSVMPQLQYLQQKKEQPSATFKSVFMKTADAPAL